MRRTPLLLLAAASLAVRPAPAQTCEGDVFLSSQAAVDAFACSAVTGDLTISGGGITDLSPLLGLELVSGDLRIEDNPALASLAGLDSLVAVGDTLFILDNALVSLAGLGNLTTVGRDLSIDDNDALTSLSGLESLTTVGYLQIAYNAVLASLDGLESLASAGGLFIAANDMLSECTCGLAGLISGDPPAFTGVGENVYISDNAPGGRCNSPAAVLATPCEAVASEPPPGLPAHFALAAPYPNPFRQAATVRPCPSCLPRGGLSCDQTDSAQSYTASAPVGPSP